MRRSSHKPAALGALGLCLVGCATEPGLPWGEAEISARVALEVPADRLRDGRVRTARDFAVRLDAVEVVLASAEITQRGRASEAPAAFDPSDPPAGYSLCHNGHCHAEDGRLVDYAAIEVEVLGGAADGPVTTLPLDASLSVPLDSASTSVTASTDLGAGELATLRITVGRLRVRGHALDLRAARRLPPDGLDFAADLPLNADVVAAWSGVIGRDAPLRHTVDALVKLPVTLLDTADFAAAGLVAADIQASVAEDATLALTTPETER